MNPNQKYDSNSLVIPSEQNWDGRTLSNDDTPNQSGSRLLARKPECRKGTTSLLPLKHIRSKFRLYLLIIALLSLIPLYRWSFTLAKSTGSASNPMMQELRKRKDIREIEDSPDELKNLRHAFFMLKKKAPTCNDPAAKTDYDCWAAYHNNFELYGCRHAIDLFWPWHRYHLDEFEKVLRNSDPANAERVQNVTLPYWNWTQTPSGRHFPKSVEQEDLNPGEYYPEDCPDPTQKCKNPLWVGGRREDTDCQSVKPECVQEALQLATWRDFGGGITAGNISDFESQAHNFMHSRYIGGPMRNPRTAAQDPIYWFFHAYIDNVWDQWQKIHEPDPCSLTNVPNPARALRIGDWPPKEIQFKNVICTRELGYEYAPFGPPIVAALPSCPTAGSACITQTPETPVVLRLSAAAAKIEKAELSLSGVTIPPDFSYDAWVLLHPASVQYRPKDKGFVDKYIATYFVAWRQGGHAKIASKHGGAHASTMNLQLDVTRKLQELARDGNVKNLVATIVFSPSNKAEMSRAIVFRRDVSFKKASLIIRDGSSPKEIPLTLRK